MGYGNRKPPLGASIQSAHPLAQDLHDYAALSEGSGNVIVNSSFTPAIGTTTGKWRPSEVGQSMYCTGGTDFRFPKHGNFLAGNFSLLIRYRPVTWPGTFTTIIDDTNRQLSVFVNASGDVSFMGVGGAVPAAITCGMTTGSLWTLVLSRTGSLITFYVNGMRKGNLSAPATTTSTAPTVFGSNPSGGGSNADAEYECVAIWRRALQPAEAAWLYAEPYAMVYKPKRRTYFVAAGSLLLKRRKRAMAA